MAIDIKLLNHLYTTMRFNIQDTAEIMGLHYATVGRCIKKHKIKKRNTTWNILKPCNLTDIQKEVITGALLGDGSIFNASKSSGHFGYASKSKQHVEFVVSTLRDLACPSHKQDLDKLTQYDKRTEKSYTRYCFRSVADSTFKGIRDLWYPNGKKLIPKDTTLTPLVCLIWYLGDGSLNKANGNIVLSTQCFQRTDIENILLPQMLQFEACLYRDKGEQFKVRIPRRNVKAFLSYIGECPVPDYVHKWKK